MMALSAQDDLERALVCLRHEIAAGVHMMLARTRTTVAEMKGRLKELNRTMPPEAFDNLLAGISDDRINIGVLGEIAFLLGYEWEFLIRKIEGPQARADAVGGGDTTA